MDMSLIENFNKKLQLFKELNNAIKDNEIINEIDFTYEVSPCIEPYGLNMHVGSLRINRKNVWVKSDHAKTSEDTEKILMNIIFLIEQECFFYGLNSSWKLSRTLEELKDRPIIPTIIEIQKPIDKVTVERLGYAFKMCGIHLDNRMIDKIIDIVELVEDKGEDVSIKDIIALKAAWEHHENSQ